jgi:hypothetical protein
MQIFQSNPDRESTKFPGNSFMEGKENNRISG